MGYTYSPEMTNQVIQINKALRRQFGNEAMRRYLEPLWYCGLSEVQLNAVNNLKRALGDDILQGSTHRSYLQLRKLGIVPRPPLSGLKRLLQMSRGNDVAFLWFLMEMYYRTTNHAVIYELNERIILSAIFWLDLFPTLRELERVLPLPHDSVARRLKQDQLKVRRYKAKQTKLMNELTKELAQIQPKSMHVHSPYFEKIILPIRRQRRNFVYRPKRSVLMPTEDPNLTRHSIKSRWFGKYIFNHTERIAKSLLNNEIDKILCTLKSGNRQSSELTSLCAHHRLINKMEDSLSNNLAKIKRDSYNRLMDVDFNRRANTRRRVLEDLDRLTEKYLAEFRKLTQKERTAATRKRLIMDMCDPGFTYLNKDDVEQMEDETVCGIIDSQLGLHLPDNSIPPTVMDNNPNIGKLKKNKPKYLQTTFVGDKLRDSVVQFCDTAIKTEKVHTQEPSQCQCCCGRKYFELGSNAWYHKFNYHKVFDAFKDDEKDEQQQRMKLAIIKALGSDVSQSDEMLQDPTTEKIDALVDSTAKRCFKESTELFEKEYQKVRWKSLKNDSHNRINLGYRYYDADDLDLMRELLRMGLDRVANDPRFILPTLHEVHQVPLLLEWIRARYGKRYSQSECRRRYNEAKIVMENVMVMLNNRFVRMKPPSLLGQARKATAFPAHNAKRKILKKYWNQYLKQFLLSFLEMGRIFYNAMGGHQNTPPNKRYFTYMPAQFREM